MQAWRRYTGTQRLQLAWSLVIVVVAGIAVGVGTRGAVSISASILVIVAGTAWILGLVLLGLRERNQWNTLVDQSSFSRQVGPHASDIETIIDARSVTASTTVPSLFAQTHTELSTTVDGVAATFTVTISFREEADTAGADPSETDGIDERFELTGSQQNIARILSPAVRSSLLEIQTPGVCTVTGEAVTYEVPFTSLSPAELDTIAHALVAIAKRVEEVGGERSSES